MQKECTELLYAPLVNWDDMAVAVFDDMAQTLFTQVE